MVLIYLLWLRRFGFWNVLLLLVFAFCGNKWVEKARKFLHQSIEDAVAPPREKSASEAEFRTDIFLVSFLMLYIARTRTWRLITVFFYLIGYFLHYIEKHGHTPNYEERESLRSIKRGLLFVQRIFLLICAYRTYTSMFLVCLMYFPKVTAAAFAIYYAMSDSVTKIAGEIIFHHLFSAELQTVATRFWAGRDGWNRIATLVGTVVLVPIITYYITDMFRWQLLRSFCRFNVFLILLHTVGTETLLQMGNKAMILLLALLEVSVEWAWRKWVESGLAGKFSDWWNQNY